MSENANRMREAARLLRDDEEWDETEELLRKALANLLDRAADIRTTIDVLDEIGAAGMVLSALDQEMAVVDAVLGPESPRAVIGHP